jgi:hypothetical protein
MIQPLSSSTSAAAASSLIVIVRGGVGRVISLQALAALESFETQRFKLLLVIA